MSLTSQLLPRRPDVLHVWAPAPALIRAARDAAAQGPFSYDEVGATRGEMPAGYAHDVQSVVLGQGDLAFARARQAMLGARMFALSWVQLSASDLDMRAGTPVPFVSRQYGLHALNVCRLAYVVDEPDEFAFAWGTLEGHLVVGEERFGLQKRENGDVVFEIKKFSRPANLLLRLAGPLVRRAQGQFSRDVLAAMVAAVRA